MTDQQLQDQRGTWLDEYARKLHLDDIWVERERLRNRAGHGGLEHVRGQAG